MNTVYPISRRPPAKVQQSKNVAPPASSYPAEVLRDGPLLYWRMGEPSGTVLDSSGNGRTGTASGGVTRDVAGPLAHDDDGAIDFDGSSGEITSTYNPFSGQKTFEAWVKTDDYAAAGNDCIIGSDLANPQFVITAAGTVAFLFSGLTQSSWTGAWVPYGDGVWVHVVVEFDDNAAGLASKLYLNGVDQGAAGGSHGAYGTVGNLTVGARAATPATFLNGKIDEVAVYNGFLDAGRVLAHYQAGKDSTYAQHVLSLSPNVGLWYRLDQLSGAIVDISGNGNNGTANGSVTYNVTGHTPEGNTALSLEGAADASSGGYVLADSYAPFPPNAKRTVVFMVKINSDQSHIVNLFCDYNSVTSNDSMVLELTSGLGGVRWYGDVTTYFPNFQDWPYTFTVGQWYHFALRIDDTASTLADQLSLWINGVNQGAPSVFGVSSTVQHFHTGTTRPFQFGRRDGVTNTEYIDGTFDEMVIYEGLLSDQHIIDLATIAGLAGVAGPASFTRGVTDSITFAEALTRGALSDVRTAADSATFAESVTRTALHPRTVADSVTFAESLIRGPLGFTRAQADSITFAEALIRTQAFSRASTDSITFAESLASSKGYTRPVTDSLTFAESLARTTRLFKASTDSLTFSESLALRIALGKTVTDSVTFAESLARAAAHPRSVTDSITFAESLARTIHLVKVIADSVTFAESLTHVIGGSSRTATDSIHFAESLATRISLRAALTDSVTFSESVATVKALRKAITDSVHFAEVVASQKGISRAITDSLTLSESVARRTALFKALIDAITFVEDLASIGSTDVFETHPDLGGVFEETPTGGIVDELIRGGVFDESFTGGFVDEPLRSADETVIRGGSVIEPTLGALIDESVRSSVLELLRSGLIDESLTGGVFDEGGTGSDLDEATRSAEADEMTGGDVDEPERDGTYDESLTGGGVL